MPGDSTDDGALSREQLLEALRALEASRDRYEQLHDLAPVAQFALDSRGWIGEVNRAGAALIGYDRAELIGRPLLSVARPADPEELWAQLRRCTEQRRTVVTDLRLITERAGTRDVHAVIAPAIDAAGAPIGFRAAFVDIAERKQAEAALAGAARDERVLRARFEALDRFSIALTSVLAHDKRATEHQLLQVVVEEARAVADAELAALGIADDLERPFTRWVVSGTPPDAGAASRANPNPRGLLGEVIRGGRSIRAVAPGDALPLAELPAGYPAMASFLGVVVPDQLRPIAYLYLINKRSASEFSEDDQRTIELVGKRAGLAIEIARLSDAERAAVAARDSVVELVSHDLRSPLSAIQLGASVLDRAIPHDGGVVRKQVDMILRFADRMKRLIGELLEASSLGAGAFRIAPSPTDVAAMVAEAVETFAAVAAGKAIRLETEAPATLGSISCDRERVIQVLVNLLGNAIRLCPDGGRIAVTVSAVPGELRFAVSDTGPGISADQLARIFDRYWRTSSGGLGLGLYIAKGVVEAHGGRLWADSELGAGSTFTFTLPHPGRTR
jgi:PAS domain S-box-containing protein